MTAQVDDQGETMDRRPLAGVKIIDATTMIAAPMGTMILADFGADVIKIEHPELADPLRTHGYEREGASLWWKVASRGKRCITLNLSTSEGQGLFRRLAAEADVVVENFRPGVMNRWGLGYETLSANHPELIMAHVSGFGSVGPKSAEPGFGTLAEAMSGFVNRNGEPDQPPMLAPFGIADGVTGITAALAVMTALFERSRSGRGQELDLAIIEPLLTVLEPQVITQDQMGITLSRTGNRAEFNAPRGMYHTADDRWVAVSASTISTATTVVRLAGGEHLADEPWFTSAVERRHHADDIDKYLVPWFERHAAAEAVRLCQEGGVPASLIYTPADILADPQYAAIGSIVTVPDERLGPVRLPGPLFRMSRTPGHIEWLGPDHGEHNEEVFGALGLTEADVSRLKESGAV
jgi:formyl-CoA transferase